MAEKKTIRPLDWRDLPLLHRLRNHGMCLDAHLAFTSGPHPVQSALLDSITPGRSDYTLVAPHDRKRSLTAVGQLSHQNKAPLARLTFIAPEAALTQANGMRLLDALAKAAGKRGAQSLIAEVDEDSRAFESLRRAGFAVYARQRIWVWKPEGSDEAPPADAWQLESSKDRPAIRILYHNLVPALVQQVEIPPGDHGRGLVYWQSAELHGYLETDHGSLGAWVHPYLHPAVEQHGELLLGALAQLTERHGLPVYICVRSYQGWMNSTLERIGLEPCTDQAVMVKRLAARIRQQVEAGLPALEGTRPEPTAPFAPLAESVKMTVSENR